MRRKSSSSTWMLGMALAAALLVPAQAAAIVVLKKGNPQPVMGYVIRQDDRVVVVREILPDGKPREQTIPREEIDELLITVAPERLAALDPAQPQLYREYAEELAEKHRDPEARDAALRLYHMAAALGDGQLRRSSLLGLAALARSPQEERRFRAAAYLYDPEHDAALLASPDDVKLSSASTAAEPLAELLAALRLVHQGKGSQAKTIVEQPIVREQLTGLAKTLTAEELLAACTAKELSDEQLYKVLRAEIALERTIGERSAESSEETALRVASWTAAINAHGLAPLPSLELESLTEFDPRACVYREGKWVKP